MKQTEVVTDLALPGGDNMICLNCGKEFKITFGRSTRKFCCTDCCRKYHNEKIKQERMRNKKPKPVIKKEPKYCLICGKELPSNRVSYCSDECAYKGKVSWLSKRHREEYKKPKAEELPKPKRKRGRPKKGISLEQAAKLAKKEGISWGEYYQKHRLWERECWY